MTPTILQCTMCGSEGTERTLTRYYEPAGNLELCEACCTTLNRDSIVPFLAYAPAGSTIRWDRYPWRPQDYY